MWLTHRKSWTKFVQLHRHQRMDENEMVKQEKIYKHQYELYEA